MAFDFFFFNPVVEREKGRLYSAHGIYDALVDVHN